MKRTVGTCGGPVTVPTVCHSIVPLPPTCEICGATPDQPHGPILKMRPRVAPAATRHNQVGNRSTVIPVTLDSSSFGTTLEAIR